MKKLKIVIFFMLIIICFPIFVDAAEKRYLLSYSPGSLFHQLVRDRIKTAYEKAGLVVDFIELPHHRSLMSADNGTVDGDVGRVPSIEKEYPNLERVNVKLMDLNGVVYTNNPEIKHFDNEILKTYRVGYVLGVEWATQKLKGLNATPVKSYEALFKMLDEGRVDLVLATEASADAILKDQSRDKIIKLEPFVFTAPIYHYVNKKNADIIPLLEKAIDEINQAGVLIFYTGVKTPLLEILRARLQEAFRRIGRSCEVRTVGSSQRALALANEQGDGEVARVPNIKEIAPDLTNNLIVIPESVLTIEFYVHTNGKQIDMSGWSSLDGLKNGFRVGTKILEQNVPGERVILPDSERLFMMLGQNRLDTVIEHSYIADYNEKKLNLTGLKRLTPPLVSKAGFPVIHKKHKELVTQVASSLAAMKADGSFEKIKDDVMASLLPKQDL